MKIICPCGKSLNTGADDSICHALLPLDFDRNEGENADRFATRIWQTCRHVWVCPSCSRMALFYGNDACWYKHEAQ